MTDTLKAAAELPPDTRDALRERHEDGCSSCRGKDVMCCAFCHAGLWRDVRRLRQENLRLRTALAHGHSCEVCREGIASRCSGGDDPLEICESCFQQRFTREDFDREPYCSVCGLVACSCGEAADEEANRA